MPSIEKAILDPFAPMSVGDALMVAVCGMVVVFIVLAALALMIMLISKVVGSFAGVKSAAAPVSGTAPAAAPAPAPKQEDDEEIIAVITAAVAAAMGTTPDPTRLTSIIRY